MTAYRSGENNELSKEESEAQREINQTYEVGSHAVQMLYKYFEVDPIAHCDEWIPIADVITELEERGLKGAQKFLMMEISGELLREGS